MQTCVSFGKAFKANMDALGLPVPSSLFATQQQAISTIVQLTGAIKTFGTRVTIGELIGAGTLSEFFAAAAALYASWYVGGVIGSLIVATDSAFDCTANPNLAQSISLWGVRNGLKISPELRQFIVRHPEVMQQRPGRRTYAALAQAARHAA